MAKPNPAVPSMIRVPFSDWLTKGPTVLMDGSMNAELNCREQWLNTEKRLWLLFAERPNEWLLFGYFCFGARLTAKNVRLIT